MRCYPHHQGAIERTRELVARAVIVIQRADHHPHLAALAARSDKLVGILHQRYGCLVKAETHGGHLAIAWPIRFNTASSSNPGMWAR